MAMWKAVALGAVQGLTEFLPVSSSAHLVLFQNWFNLHAPELFFDVALHLGTLVAVLAYYHRDVVCVLRDITVGAGEWCGRKAGLSQIWNARSGFRLGTLVLLGSFPTAVIGIALNDFFETMFGSLFWVSLALFINAGILWSSRASSARTSFQVLDWKRALLIGTAQGIAIMPGISRSGLTIVAALVCGLEREEAVRFSFFLSIISIAGASLLELKDSAASSFSLLQVGAGAAVAFGVGLFAIFFLLRVVRRGKLHGFAYYSVLAAILAFLTYGSAR